MIQRLSILLRLESLLAVVHVLHLIGVAHWLRNTLRMHRQPHADLMG